MSEEKTAFSHTGRLFFYQSVIPIVYGSWRRVVRNMFIHGVPSFHSLDQPFHPIISHADMLLGSLADPVQLIPNFRIPGYINPVVPGR